MPSRKAVNVSYELDPELAPVMAALAQRAAAAPAPARGDWKALRASGELGQAYLATLVPPSTGVRAATFHATAADGASIELRWYTTHGQAGAGRAVVYAHGGGMVLGTLDLYDRLISWYVAETGVPFLSAGYRRAPDEGRGTTLAEDVFAALGWLLAHAGELGVDPARVAVMGDSGGGAPAAGAAILARDRGIPLARQILVYPMLDDRNQVPGPVPAACLTWSYDNNYTAWQAVLGDRLGTGGVPPAAAPARLADHAGLPPAYIDVGDLDIFRDEDIAYAHNLARAGVPVELHVYPGAPHGWDRLAPGSRSARQAMADRARVIAAL
ncbi:MAG: alpha/beta hydrolase [Streptosporangiales bacterium]